MENVEQEKMELEECPGLVKRLRERLERDIAGLAPHAEQHYRAAMAHLELAEASFWLASMNHATEIARRGR